MENTPEKKAEVVAAIKACRRARKVVETARVGEQDAANKLKNATGLTGSMDQMITEATALIGAWHLEEIENG